MSAEASAPTFGVCSHCTGEKKDKEQWLYLGICGSARCLMIEAQLATARLDPMPFEEA